MKKQEDDLIHDTLYCLSIEWNICKNTDNQN